jgi:catechol 2,3-dioxygenase-like lactoylglutathione lyase family enzyme
VTSVDGVTVPLQLYRPVGSTRARRSPGVVMLHGGPEGQSQPVFSPVVQALAARGYAVALPNIRGSTGYGKRYYSLDDTTRRLDWVRDLSAIHQWLAGAGLDPTRAALWGTSYGGYLVLARCPFQPELWAAGVDIAGISDLVITGISDLVAFLERTADDLRTHREREYDALATDREFLSPPPRCGGQCPSCGQFQERSGDLLHREVAAGAVPELISERRSAVITLDRPARPDRDRMPRRAPRRRPGAHRRPPAPRPHLTSRPESTSTMDAASNGLGALTLFVEDLGTVTMFYRDVLDLSLVYQDDVSSVLDLGGTLINLLVVGAAPALVAPAGAAPVGATAQMMLSLFVEDVDAVCADLRERGVALLNGPLDRPWGKRTAAFTDPVGTVWEIAQDIAADAHGATGSTS